MLVSYNTEYRKPVHLMYTVVLCEWLRDWQDYSSFWRIRIACSASVRVFDTKTANILFSHISGDIPKQRDSDNLQTFCVLQWFFLPLLKSKAAKSRHCIIYLSVRCHNDCSRDIHWAFRFHFCPLHIFWYRTRINRFVMKGELEGRSKI